MLTDLNEIKRRLQAGAELRNHGCGWWLAKPHQPYTQQESVQVPDDLVALLEAQGHVKTEMLTVSIVGRWVEPDAIRVGVAL